MTIGSREHYEMMIEFEKSFPELRLDREPSSEWTRGHIYENGEANLMFKAFSAGYATARVNYMNGSQE
jgi:hypothetical protein